MNNGNHRALPVPFQIRFEKGLFLAAWLLGTAFMLLTAFRYVIPYEDFAPFVCWYAVVLIAVTVGYLVISWIGFPDARNRIKRLFGKMRSYEYLFMIGFFLWYILVCAIHQLADQGSYFLVEDWYLFDTAVSALILFPMALYAGRERAWKYVDCMLVTVTVAYSVFLTWCMYYLIDLDFLTLPSGNYIGITPEFNLMICSHYNITGAYSFCFFATSCYMIFTQKLPLRIFGIYSAALNLCVLLLTNSRTVYVGALILAAGCAFGGLWQCCRKTRLPVRIAVSAVGAAAVAFLIILLRPAVFEWFDDLSGFTFVYGLNASSQEPVQLLGPQIQQVTAQAQYASTQVQPIGIQIQQVSSPVRQINTGLSDREEIWISAFRVMISSPLAFLAGVTPRSVTWALQALGDLGRAVSHAHNAILQVGVGFGVPAMIAFAVFCVRMTVKCLCLVFRKQGKKDFIRIWMASMIVLSLLLINMVEAYLIAYFSIMSSLFFLVCGAITAEKGDESTRKS